MSENNQESPFEEFENQNNKTKIASKRYRIGASMIDFFVYWIVGIILGTFFGEPMQNDVGFNLNGIPAITMFLAGFLLWPVSEGIWGQTIGKRFLDLKVVSEDNKPIGLGQAFGRFFLGFIDFFFLVGIIIAANNKRNQRIGDLALNTIVISIKKT